YIEQYRCLYEFYVLIMLFLFFFFFQAEDGIRDRTVTGVQTCALPISAGPEAFRLRDAPRCRSARERVRPRHRPRRRARLPHRARSEERRVGKECRTRWSADH